MSSADRVAHIDGQLNLAQPNEAIHALPAEYKQNNKTEQSIYECLLGFCFIAFSAPPQILAASTVSSAQFRNRRNDG